MIGSRNRPEVCRAPMVIMRIAAAVTVSIVVCFCVSGVVMGGRGELAQRVRSIAVTQHAVQIQSNNAIPTNCAWTNLGKGFPAGSRRLRTVTIIKVQRLQSTEEDAPMFGDVNGLWGLLVLVADVWAIVNIFQSSVSTGKKVLWTVLVILLPVLGFLIWLIAGPKGSK